MIAEDRTITREKYSEAKLLANFLQASPAYLTAEYQNNTFANGSYTGNQAIAVTALFGNETNFYVVRQAAYNSLGTADYRITFPTKSQGNITVPQLGNSQLSLHGRDSKIFVTDYDVGGVSVLYSTAEIFTVSREDAQIVDEHESDSFAVEEVWRQARLGRIHWSWRDERNRSQELRKRQDCGGKWCSGRREEWRYDFAILHKLTATGCRIGQWSLHLHFGYVRILFLTTYLMLT